MKQQILQERIRLDNLKTYKESPQSEQSGAESSCNYIMSNL